VGYRSGNKNIADDPKITESNTSKYSVQHSSVPLYQTKQPQMKALKHLNNEVEDNFVNCGDNLPLLLVNLQQMSLKKSAYIGTPTYWKIGQSEGRQKIISVNHRLDLQHLKSKHPPLNLDTIGLSGLAHSLYSAFW
jgi:hypothetical protein